ncbi:hypothetical protein CY34DRAFT_16978 [Suillus luteus UH-Slu-Lm8-n1]|uniref:Uncharacterized protein n=1 Tax=Suillus luteus UH-Slu-Lm8-n1 TaxID=930992 RepID=A0A0D0ABS0_9AGAM|nr:hypothetical protein CY34DRAFT_16978 [Suillus luteus UH-Slu-Lm8-n1]
MSLHKHTDILVEPFISDKLLHPVRFDGGNDWELRNEMVNTIPMYFPLQLALD